MSSAADAWPDFPPQGYELWRQGPIEVIACSSVADDVRAALEHAPTLGEWGARSSFHRVTTGRGSVYGAQLGPHRVAVRHYHRGGLMAPLLGDRYLDRWPRPYAELEVSDRLRAAGIATPRVLAGDVSPARPGYRADLVTMWLEPGHDLAEMLRPNVYPEVERLAAATAAGRLIGDAHRAGLDHPDLTAHNIFVQPRVGGGWGAALLDLDRAKLRADSPVPEQNLRRLNRWFEKAHSRGKVVWDEAEREAFGRGYCSSPSGGGAEASTG